MPNRREVIAGTSLLLAARVSLACPPETGERRLITEAALAQPAERGRAILIGHAEPLGSGFLAALPADRYAARLSPANQLLLREMLKDRRIRIAGVGEQLLFDWRS